jgi:hypothetical protein
MQGLTNTQTVAANMSHVSAEEARRARDARSLRGDQLPGTVKLPGAAAAIFGVLCPSSLDPVTAWTKNGSGRYVRSTTDQAMTVISPFTC